MDSSELYHVKQQFTLSALKTLVNLTLPDPSSPEYAPTLIYKARAHIAIGQPQAVATLVPESSENVALKAVAALARYVAAADEAALEELRDLCIEIEGEDVEGDERDKELVRILAATAFTRAGEVEEALETLGAGAQTSTENLETVALIVQIYLSINRADLAKKEFERAKRWAEDDLLLQLIEASIGLVTGRDGYANASAFYTEQLGNPSLSSPHLLTARGVTRLLRGEVSEARSDFEEAHASQGEDAETLGATAVAAGLGAGKKGESDELWSRLSTQYPDYPGVTDLAKKAEVFDEFAGKFIVPPLAVPVVVS